MDTITMITGLERITRFFQFDDPSVQLAVIGCVLLGLNCGILGTFIIARKMALVGDTLSHAILPGIALGFLWNGTKNMLHIFIGALIASLLGAWTIVGLKKTTSIKEDSVLGIVLSGFYGIGICLMTMIQQHDGLEKAGLNTILLGQASALSEQDVIAIATLSFVIIIVFFIFYKEWVLTSFDPIFANSNGLSSTVFHYILMVLLGFVVVTALKASGTLLVTALLIIPAATAYLLSKKMHHVIIISALLGMASSLSGVFLSFLGNKMPTGPLIVISASFFFIIAFLLAPNNGLLIKWKKHLKQQKRIYLENGLKAIYKIIEKNHLNTHSLSINTFIAESGFSNKSSLDCIRALKKQELILVTKNQISLTKEGLKRSLEIVRNHRLWELYLTSEASYPKDHVHEDAESIEHFLSEETIKKLEEQLSFPSLDPHGKHIPRLHTTE